MLVVLVPAEGTRGLQSTALVFIANVLPVTLPDFFVKMLNHLLLLITIRFNTFMFSNLQKTILHKIISASWYIYFNIVRPYEMGVLDLNEIRIQNSFNFLLFSIFIY